jgi:hypothetical protein
MSAEPRIPGAARIFGIGVPFLMCALLASALAAFGRTAAALGVGIGFGLYLVNTALLFVTLRSLAEEKANRHVAALAGASSAGRLLLLGVALGGVAVAMGRDAFFGTAGGLLVSQISFLLRRMGTKGEG